MVVIVDKDIDGNAVQTDNPLGIDFDAQGKMYIGELAGGRVLRRDVDGTLAVIAGDGSRGYAGDGGPAGKATFDGIHNVAVTPEGDIYVSDAWNHCVRKISASTGAIETFAGTGTAGYRGDDGPATEAMFDFVMCVSFSPDYKQLFLADLKNRRVRAIDMETKIVRTIAGNGQKGVPADGDIATESPLIDPRAVAVDDAGHVYILERSGHALRVVRPDGTIVTVAGTGKKGAQDGHALDASFNSPKHLSIAGDGKVFIADDGNNIIRVYDPSTQTVSSIRTKQQLRRPHGVCIGSDGTLFVVDSWNDRILKTLVQ
tara:strand:+ start:38876 stop:39820 length:945 start_codon:yes stop_codon:yes gene_type:complete